MRPTSAIAAAALLLSGCAARSGTEHRHYAFAVAERPGPEGLIISAVDLNDDGRPEVYNYLRLVEGQRQLVRKEIDLNRDGGIDQVSRYEHGQLVEREWDEDFDGRMDRVEHFLEGERVLAELDADGDGSAEQLRYFVGGVIARKERDTDGDGRVDTWEYFDHSGVSRIGVDEDGDGVIDRRVE